MQRPFLSFPVHLFTCRPLTFGTSCLRKFNFTKPYANGPIIYMRLIRKSRVPINRLLIELFSTDDDIGINQSVDSEFTVKFLRKTR